jgi:iron uptake system component EfeO
MTTPPTRLSAALSALVLTVTVAGCSSAGGHRTGPQVVTVSVSGCGNGWQAGRAGAVRLALTNTDVRPGEAMIADARTGAVYADVEPLAPGTRRTVSLELGPGRYEVRCAMADESMVTGPGVVLTG